MSARRGVLVLLCAFVAAACGKKGGEGEVTGFLTVPGCLEPPDGVEACAVGGEPRPQVCDSFDLEADFFTLEAVGDEAILRFQHGGEDFAREDGLLLHIRDVRQIRGGLGSPIAVGNEAPVRGALGLFERCPEATESLELSGRVTFESFGTEKGDRVAGTLDDTLVRDGRTGALRGQLRGDFDFTVRRGPPYRRFSGR